ncbi:MAG: PD40 domain-containing protein, partial [Betaproteobacteria bacterium]|nr:PD40 domain-containing protein [Betaproteobacteria bacterium]
MATIIGTPRNDLLLGTPADDLIFGLSGDDALVGQSGADVLDGGLGADYLRGGAGNDTYRVDALGDRVVETADALSMVRVSAAASGVQANDTSFDPVISASGRFIAFGSLASNLAFGETNVVQDVFVKDLLSGAVLRASTDANGVQGNNTSFGPSISADGRYVAFLSNATNLVADDRSVVADVFVKDMVTGAVVRASVSDRGVEANDSSLDAAISGDGHFVAFTSLASNLVVGDRNVATDVFVKDLHSGAIVIASSDSRGVSSIGGSSDATISADGSVVAFSSNASDLVPG